MFDLDLWREIFQSINKNRARGLLSGFTVAFAIMLFTILFGIANGLENTFDELFVKTADNAIYIYSGRTSKPYKGLQVGRKVSLYNEDFEHIKNEYRNKIEYITPKLNRNFQVSYINKKGSYNVIGVHPDAQHIEKVKIKDGRFINLNDIKNHLKVIIIGRLIEEDLFGKISAIGQYINLEGINYKVVGVFTDNGGDSQERLAYLPTTTVQQIYIGKDAVGEINLTYNRKMSSDEALTFGTDLTKNLRKRKNVAPTDQRAIRVNNMALQTKGIETMTGGLGILIFIIGLGTLIAGIVGISNIMIFIVKERTKEIGIRKALGATPKSIVSIILIESVLITALAGYLGLLIGVGVLKWVGPSLKEYYITNPEVHPNIILTATIVLIAAGTLAGFVPAQKASRIKPIIALRNG
ncbi:ABC transporter permease [Seonamhaeicola aphaedonensis]|uniref:Putative ABC transport system permease protein n=1 Tax=Seonamhaeicola aphaedonensis TaxID=1461338 RepID=A0A3D9HGR1_9FLAO|nr:ABC transporter permease [Seonamhaeicola aphaedonensis]RED48679.1 putative ABC transport system permease protein [Seonamhaeicola aphaedonensis]